MENRQNAGLICSKESQLRVNLSHPFVLGAGAMVLGFVIGSGRWDWLRKGVTQLGASLGGVAVSQFTESFRAQNSIRPSQAFSGDE